MTKQSLWDKVTKSKKSGLEITKSGISLDDCCLCNSKNAECINVCINEIDMDIEYTEPEYIFMPICKKCFLDENGNGKPLPKAKKCKSGNGGSRNESKKMEKVVRELVHVVMDEIDKIKNKPYRSPYENQKG